MFPWRTAVSAFVACVVCLWGAGAGTARAALSELGGTGILELQSAESKRPARLELGVSGSYQRLGLGDTADTKLNVLRGALSAAFGLPGGFEISGTVPALFHYTSRGAAASPLDEELDAKLGDVAGRLRWTGPFVAPGLRWGLEGEALFSTGSDREETYPDRAAVKPYTAGKNSYSVRSMLTWDGLRAGSGVPLRLHANAAYTVQQDEGRFLIPRAPLPLELPAPTRDRANDFASLGAAVELDLQRLTLFGEVVTDHFVYERTLVKGKENRVAVTPGLRLWFPGGVTLMGAYCVSLSEDDKATAFDPGRAFPDGEWRVAISLGTVYRGARARAEEAAPSLVVMPAPAAAPPAPAMMVPTEPAVPDSATLAKLRKEREIMQRRDVQEEPRAAKPPAPSAAGLEAPDVVKPPSAPVSRLVPSAGQGARLLDSDRDGIPDEHDQCPLLAEDMDGFQDLDGCPDLDNDQDGIPDIRDQCPNDPETFNGYYDLDGCPDETPIRWVGPRPGRLMTPGPAAPPETTSSALIPVDTLVAARRPVAAAPVETLAPAPVRAAVAPGAKSDTGLPPLALPPAATTPMTATPPGPAAARLSADSLRMALQFERERTKSLEGRLAQSETERRDLMTRVMAVPRPAAAPESIGPAPVVQPSASRAELRTGLDEALRQNAELRTRVRDLELRQEQILQGQTMRTTPVAAPSGPTLITTPGATASADLAARLAVLESELGDVRRQAELRERPTTSRDSAGRAIVTRLQDIEAHLAALRMAAEEAPPPPAEAAPSARTVQALDILLPAGVPRVFPEIEFRSGSVQIMPSGVAVIAGIAAALHEVPEACLRIVGYTDDVGDGARNLALSRERAQAVANALVERGVDRERLTVEGRGEEAPVASNRTEAGRRLNRRVEFVRTR